MFTSLKRWWHERRLSSQDERVRRAAADALGELGDARALRPLIYALKDRFPEVRNSVRTALQEVDPDWRGSTAAQQAMPVFAASLRENDEDVRLAAAEALRQFGDARAVEPLVAALKDKNQAVRAAAAEALGRLRDRRAVLPLIAAWQKHGPTWEDTLEFLLTGSPVLEALRAIKDARAVETFIAALRDKDELVRKMAAEALGEFRDSRAVEPLIAALKDWTPQVRKAAAEALRAITGQFFGASARDWQQWWEQHGRQ